MIRIISWNIGRRLEPWRELSQSDADIALLQEAGNPPKELASNVRVVTATDFANHGYDRWPMVLRLSDKIAVKGFKLLNLPRCPKTQDLPPDTLAVSDPTTIAVALVTLPGGQEFHVVSLYGRWLKPYASTNSKWGVGYPDASIHRAISDLSVLIGSLNPSTHRILVAGDFNMIYGATEKNSLALPARDQTVIDRFKALGLEFLGPQYPAGRRAEPIPQGLPATTKNLPTYYTTHQKMPAKAQNQLDYVFASRGFHEKIKVRALNFVEGWGSSDHCRLLIEVAA